MILSIDNTEVSNAKQFESLVAKLDTDHAQATAGGFAIRGIPTVMLFKGGQVVDQLVGLVDKVVLKQMVDKHIDKAA